MGHHVGEGKKAESGDPAAMLDRQCRSRAWYKKWHQAVWTPKPNSVTYFLQQGSVSYAFQDDLHKQHHQLGTKCPNTWLRGDVLHSNHDRVHCENTYFLHPCIHCRTPRLNQWLGYCEWFCSKQMCADSSTVFSLWFHWVHIQEWYSWTLLCIYASSDKQLLEDYFYVSKTVSMAIEKVTLWGADAQNHTSSTWLTLSSQSFHYSKVLLKTNKRIWVGS